MQKIRRNDEIIVIAGKDKGKRGKVLKVLADDRLVVGGINMIKRHQRPTQKLRQGGIIEREGTLSISNVMVVCSACGKATKVGYKYIESEGKQKKVRFCKKCNEVME